MAIYVVKQACGNDIMACVYLLIIFRGLTTNHRSGLEKISSGVPESYYLAVLTFTFMDNLTIKSLLPTRLLQSHSNESS